MHDREQHGAQRSFGTAQRGICNQEWALNEIWKTLWLTTRWSNTKILIYLQIVEILQGPKQWFT